MKALGTHRSVAAAQLKQLRVPDAQAGVHLHEQAGELSLRTNALSVLISTCMSQTGPSWAHLDERGLPQPEGDVHLAADVLGDGAAERGAVKVLTVLRNKSQPLPASRSPLAELLRSSGSLTSRKSLSVSFSGLWNATFLELILHVTWRVKERHV